MENKLYRVNNNIYNLNIDEFVYSKKTESFYWNERGQRNAIKTNNYDMFEDRDRAIIHLKHLIDTRINSAESALNYAKEKLQKFNEMYKQK